MKEVHGTHRVYLALDDVPGLAMSRSLGDYVAHSAGVLTDTTMMISAMIVTVSFMYNHCDSVDMSATIAMPKVQSCP